MRRDEACAHGEKPFALVFATLRTVQEGARVCG
jgi:hypothetical protein